MDDQTCSTGAATDLAIDISILGVEPAGEYHARAGEFFSSHQLLDFMKCP